MTIKYLSLFTGIGGFEQGIQQSNKAKQLECIGYSEIDKYATKVYKKHYPNHTPLGDATRIQTDSLPSFDLLVGGFPCQAFSHAGKRMGFNDTRGTLFFEISRILKDKKPKYFLLENVRGLLSHDRGRTIQTMLRILADLGYYARWQIINSKNHGVPQNRQRLYIKGILREREGRGREILSLRGDGEQAQTHNNNRVKPLNDKPQAQKVYSTEGIAPTLMANGGGQGGKTGLYKVNSGHFIKKIDGVGNTRKIDGERVIPCTDEGNFFTLLTRHRCMNFHKNQDNYVFKKQEKIYLKNNTKQGYIEAKENDGIVLGQPRARGRVQKQRSPTLLTGDGCGCGTLTNYRIRRLTPIECERLQGFPDNYTKYGYDGEQMSDTQRYKMCGNAVTTNVIRDIFNNWTLYED